MKSIVFYLLLPLFSTVVSASEIDGKTDSLGNAYVYSHTPSTDDSFNELFFVKRPGASQIRVLVSILAPSGLGSMSVKLLNSSGYLSEERNFSSSSKLEEEYWSSIIYSDSLSIELQGSSDRFFVVKLKYVSYDDEGYSPIPFSIIEPPDIEHVYKLKKEMPQLFEASHAIVKINYNEDASGPPKYCSGFLIHPQHVITNQHCIDTKYKCDSARVLFGFQYGADGILRVGKQFRCASFRANKSVDYSILTLKESVPKKIATPLKFAASTSNVPGLTALIHHPGKYPKMASIRNCKIKELPVISPTSDTAIDFSHTCDSSKGSSGAPILNERGEVIGVHHWGFEAGSPWSELNRAIQGKALCTHVAC